MRDYNKRDKRYIERIRTSATATRANPLSDFEIEDKAIRIASLFPTLAPPLAPPRRAPVSAPIRRSIRQPNFGRMPDPELNRLYRGSLRTTITGYTEEGHEEIRYLNTELPTLALLQLPVLRPRQEDYFTPVPSFVLPNTLGTEPVLRYRYIEYPVEERREERRR